ncbi:hypothetical protein ACFL0T_08105, partial [Candidatus Omnitrophota bacterium]
VILTGIVGSVLYTTMSGTYFIVKKNQDINDAYYVGRSAAEYAIHIVEDPGIDPLNSATWPNGSSFTGFGGDINVTIADDGGGGFDIVATATASSKTKRIRVNVTNDGDIAEWKG